MKHWGRKMKITQEKLIQIIKEEYQKILNEKRVRLKNMDINFHGNDMGQIISNRGKMAITKKGARDLLYILQKQWGRSITGY
tara:strand:+ start:345 stop:590 length:246 start_codon:yes stop_codon:yes gene_type:complete